MALDSTTISMVMAGIASMGLFLNAIVHWDKVRPVLVSSATLTVVKTALLLGCFWLGPWALLAGAMVYVLLETVDFIRRDDNSCAAVGSTILTTVTGVFNFAIQFAFAIKGE